MKKSDIEKRLKDDLTRAAPSDFGAVMKRCKTVSPLPAAEPEAELIPAAAGACTGASSPSSRRGGKRAAALALAAVVLCGILFSVLAGILGLFSGGGSLPLPLSEGYFLFDINPSVELSYDKKGRVTEARGLNGDGEVLLCGLELAGKSYEEAADVLFGQCVRLGYFSAEREDNAVLVSANLASGGADETLTAEMKKHLSESFASNKIRGVVITGVENPALNEAAAAYGIDSQKYGLILEYLALGGVLPEEKYSQITVRELYKEISKLQEKKKDEDADKLKADLSEIEEKLFEAASEAICDLTDELEDCIKKLDSGDKKDEARKKMYKERIEELSEYAEEIEDASSEAEAEALVNRLLASLAEMSAAEPDEALKALLDMACEKIKGIYDGLTATLRELELLSATAEETNAARLEKFGQSGGGSEFDFDEWQKEKEDFFTSFWYDFKTQWEKDRAHDLDD